MLSVLISKRNLIVIRTEVVNVSCAVCRAVSNCKRHGLFGLLHESYVHECLKSSLAFRKPAVAVVSRCPARTEGL